MTRTIPTEESLQIEFKSDRAKLFDRDIVLTVVCLANTAAGEIYLGVEDDTTVTGLHPEQQDDAHRRVNREPNIPRSSGTRKGDRYRLPT